MDKVERQLCVNAYATPRALGLDRRFRCLKVSGTNCLPSPPSQPSLALVQIRKNFEKQLTKYFRARPEFNPDDPPRGKVTVLLCNYFYSYILNDYI